MADCHSNTAISSMSTAVISAEADCRCSAGSPVRVASAAAAGSVLAVVRLRSVAAAEVLRLARRVSACWALASSMRSASALAAALVMAARADAHRPGVVAVQVVSARSAWAVDRWAAASAAATVAVGRAVMLVSCCVSAACSAVGGTVAARCWPARTMAPATNVTWPYTTATTHADQTATAAGRRVNTSSVCAAIVTPTLAAIIRTRSMPTARSIAATADMHMPMAENMIAASMEARRMSIMAAPS